MALLSRADYSSCPPAKSPRCHLERRKCYPQVQAGGRSSVSLPMCLRDAGFASRAKAGPCPLGAACRGTSGTLASIWLSSCHLKGTGGFFGGSLQGRISAGFEPAAALLLGWGWDEQMQVVTTEQFQRVKDLSLSISSQTDRS